MKKLDTKVLLSTLWIFVLFNYLYCDVLTLMDPEVLNKLLTGTIDGMEMTPGFLLGAGILMEIPIMMVLLSRILGYKVNRWANIVAGSIMTLVQIATLMIGTSTMYYIFFSIIEIATTAFVVWTAVKWKNSLTKTA